MIYIQKKIQVKISWNMSLIYNPFLQKRGYMETSAYLHIYWNNLYKDKEMVGISQYDMYHLSSYKKLDKSRIYN